jgi:hypothetical protein
VSNALVDPAPDRRWPLHPQPSDWEDLQTWVGRIADMYGVSYDAFLLNALDHTGCGARDLDQAPIGVLVTLSAGTGVPIERLLDMTTLRVMRRVVHMTQAWLETTEGQAARDSVAAIASHRRRQMSATRGF